MSFESVGEVMCNNARNVNTYEFIDPAPSGGVSYYRIVQRDQDGTETYSSVATVRIEELTASIYPNPFTSDFSVLISGAGEKAEVELLDIHGRMLLKISAEEGEEVKLGSGLSAGVYVVQVRSGGEVKSYKIVKQ